MARLDEEVRANDHGERARSLLARQPLFDAHLDSLQRAVDLGHDLGQRTPGHFDLVRGREGGLGSVVLVSWVDPAYLPDGSQERARALMGAALDLEDRHSSQLALVRRRCDLSEIHASGRIAGILGIEGGHAIEERMDVLDALLEKGLRILTLVWNNHLPWIRSCQPGAGAGVPAGLSDFGADVVRRMNEGGAVVDLSHAGRRAFYDALEASERPVVASHSGCSALYDHQRNLDDDQLRRLAENGGVVGIVFHPGFLDADADAEERHRRRDPSYAALRGGDPTAQHLAQSEWMQANAAPLSFERVLDHIEHACEVAGPEHVGIGSDYDGIERGPAGLETADCYPRLVEGLLARGFDEGAVEGIVGKNFERVFEACLPD